MDARRGGGAALQVGTVFAGFTIERLLGVGGMGSVYLARHPRLARVVALKVLSDGIAADPKARIGFEREAALAARLEHPNIVAVFDRSSPDEPRLWLSMQYIAGGDANMLLRANPSGLPADRAIRLITDAGRALDYAHSQGVLHRDVKPANLLIEHTAQGGERALLTDFGIARSFDDTHTLSSIAATFAYVAPERFLNRPSDHRADIYSLGCTFHQLLTGRTPFPHSEQAAVIAAHLHSAPPAPSTLNPSLPAALDAVIAKALAKDPAARYASCAEFADAAHRAIAIAPIPQPMPLMAAAPPSPPRNMTRRRLLIGGAFAVPLVTAAATAGVLALDHFTSSKAPASHPRADARDAALAGARQAAITMNTMNPDDADGSIRAMESAATGELLIQLKTSEDQMKTLAAQSDRIDSTVSDIALVKLDDSLNTGTAFVVLRQNRTKRGGGTVTNNRVSWQLDVSRTPDGWKVNAATAIGGPVGLDAKSAPATNPAAPTGPDNLALVDDTTDQVKTAAAHALTTLYQYRAADIDKYKDAVKPVLTEKMYQEFLKSADVTVATVKQSGVDTSVRLDPSGVTQLTSDSAELLVYLTVTDNAKGTAATNAEGPIVVHMQKSNGQWLIAEISDVN